MHVRRQLINQAVTELVAITEFSGRVKSTRLDAIRTDELPYCNVYSDVEDIEVQTLNSPGLRKLIRKMELSVEVHETGDPDTIDTDIDALVAEVEKILGNSTLNDLAHEVTPMGYVFDYDSAGDVPIGTATLTWLVRYFTVEGDPDTAI